MRKVTRTQGKGAIVFLRRSGIEDMYYRGNITDAEKGAADRFGNLWTMLHSDGLKAVDYGQQRVDGRRHGDWSPSVDGARKHLSHVRHALGDKHFTVLRVAAGAGGGLVDVMSALGVRSKGTASGMVKAALAALCEFWCARH